MILRITHTLALLLALSFAIIVPADAAGTSCSLSVASIPEHGMVSIDGKNMGNAPLADIPLICGAHTVRVEKGGYLAYNNTIVLADGAQEDVIANLEKVPDRGQVTIQSEPSGGDLYIDGKYRGTTPAIPDNLLPGRHEVLIRKAGYEDYRDVISVSAEFATEYREYLVPLPGAGFLSVTSYPEGADVWIDGIAAGTTPSALLRYPAGNHTVEIAKKGYWNFTSIILVKGGESVLAKADLIALPTTSRVYLDSAPQGAGVYLNETFKGFTPIPLETLPSGDYRVEFRFLNDTATQHSFSFAPGATHEILALLGNGTEVSIEHREWTYQNTSRMTRQPGWISENAVPVVERKFTWSANGQESSITLDIPRSLYDYYKLNRTYPTTVTPALLSEYSINEREREYFHALVNRLKDASESKSYRARNDYHNVVAFVQNIAYEKDIDPVTGAESEYPKHPIETLADGNGDCEDTAILAAALLREMDYEVALVLLPKHAAVAVACDTCNGYYYDIEGQKYYYLETAIEGGYTSLGTMDTEYQSVKAQVIPLG
jgi:hypothetical protein